jgi:O-antigen/teichoic acid export membrane protein
MISGGGARRYDPGVSTATGFRGGAGGGVRRLGWGLADQALSSLTNFALAVLVARAVSTSALGAFGLAFTTYTITLGATRALCQEPLTVRYSALSEREWRSGAAAATGVALVLGLLAGVVCVAAAFFFAGTLRPTLLVLGIGMPGLIVQDAWRSAFFSHLRGRAAFGNDLVWALAQVVLVAIVVVAGTRSVPAFVAAWAGAAAVAALFGIVQASVVPRPGRTGWWLSHHRDLGPRYLVEFVARNAAQSGAMYATAAFAGLSAAGALRGAQVVLGPLNVLNMGVTAPGVAESVRIARRSPRRMMHAVRLLAFALVVVFVLWGLVVYVLPDSVGEALLKRSWHPAHDVIPAYTAVMAASGMLTAATVGLRAMAAAKRSLRSRLVTGVLAVAGGTAGAATSGAVGAATGLALGLWIGGIQWWQQLGAAVAEEEVRRAEADAPAPPAPDPAAAQP